MAGNYNSRSCNSGNIQVCKLQQVKGTWKELLALLQFGEIQVKQVKLVFWGLCPLRSGPVWILNHFKSHPSMFKLTSTVTKSFSTSVPRRFQILGLQQVAIGGLDKEKMAKLWTGRYYAKFSSVLAFRRLETSRVSERMSTRTSCASVKVPRNPHL